MLVCSPRNSHLRHLFSRLSISSILRLFVALCSTLLSFALFRLAATISPNECERLNDYLGPKTPGGCFVLGHNDGDDPFTHGVEKGETPFQGKDATHHRNSWLWPKLARRVTKNSDLHQSRWRRPVEVSGDECSRICETRIRSTIVIVILLHVREIFSALTDNISFTFAFSTVSLLKIKLEDSQEALDELPVGCKKFVMS